MAENKKSFIAYCDWLELFENLTNEEAGKLVKHLFNYVNDKNPKSDKITELLFIQIKQSLKRDLKKYENFIEKQRGNGALGGRPKKNPLEPKKPKPLLQNPLEPKKPDSVSDNDNVSENETKNIYLDYLNKEHFQKFEQMKMKLGTIDKNEFLDFFFNKLILEDSPLEFNKIQARFNILFSNWKKDMPKEDKSRHEAPDMDWLRGN